MNGVPEGIPNGQDGSQHVSNATQIWERPWKLEEMRQNSANWSLAADSGLLLFLQDFSQRMLSRTHEIEKQLDSLIRDTKATDSSLHSVFNDFLMLSNTQFIENRVYDEEVEEPLPKADAVERQTDQKSREQKEAELIPKMQEAVTYGLKVLESAFEHLDIKAGNSDSEDEEANDRLEAILEPKDLYVDRPLPFLIGSQAFMEQEDVGLGDLSSDELSVDSERDSVIDSEDDKDADNLDEDFMQEEDHHPTIKKNSSMVSYEEDDEESDIFGDSDKEEDDDAKSAGPTSFADELAARIKSELVSKPTEDRASAEDDSDDMFKPPKMDFDDEDEDDEFSPFGEKSGLFSGGKGLFDDDDKGDDLFSDAPKLPVSIEGNSPNGSIKTTTKATEPHKPVKKIPPGAVSIFPDNNLFGPANDTLASSENGTATSKTQVTAKPPSISGGLFDEEDDEEDDFFGGKSQEKSSSAAQIKAKPPKNLDLFEDDDEDGDIFSEKAAQNKKVEEPVIQSAKKMPAGAISMFGPSTKSLLSEGLKKRQHSSSNESEKSEKNGPAPDVGKAVTQNPKPLTSSLFSDDEDTQIFPSIPRSQSDLPTMSQSRNDKPCVSLFDDDDEEDLFASASKSKPKPNPAQTLPPQPSKTIPSSLFSDEEDQWMGPKDSKQETKTGGMKASISAPANFHSVSTLQKSSLFDDDDEDDQFAPAESSQKKPQRVGLLFEDEHNEDKDSLFRITTDDSTNAAVQPNTVLKKSPESAEAKKGATQKPSLPQKPSVPQKPAAKPPEKPLASSEAAESKKKPVGAVSLFGGIDVLAKKEAKNMSDEDEDDFKGPPPIVKTQAKVKTNTLSLFDDDDDEAEDEQNLIFTPSKPSAKNTAKPAELRPQLKSTGVFLDEKFLFSPTQQKDNDPDVDIFAVSEKTTSSKLSLTKPSLFAEDDEEDLFGSTKPQSAPSKGAEQVSTSNDRAPLGKPETGSDLQKPAASPVEPKEPSSRIGRLQASLKINPAVFLPGSAPSLPGAVSVLPGLDPSSPSMFSSMTPSPATTPITARLDSEGGVNFDTPIQAPTLHGANKACVKSNPAAFLPGSAPVNVFLGLDPNSSSGVSSSSMSPSPATTPTAARVDSEAGISFDTPIQAPTLLSANKNRIRGSLHRRLPSRAARQASQRSVEEQDDIPVSSPSDGSFKSSSSVLLPPGASSQTHTPQNSAPAPSSPSHSQPPLTQIATKPSLPTLPESNNSKKQDSNPDKVPPPFEDDDIFASDIFFDSVTDTPAAKPAGKKAEHQASAVPKTDFGNLRFNFDNNSDDLFQTVKPKSAAKTAKTSPFLKDDDDDYDIFGEKSNSTMKSTSSRDVKSSNSFPKQDIFEDDIAVLPKAHKKEKDKATDISLFDDDVDIFADLTDTFTPKEKTKIKAATKSIFDDDMDDIFAPSTVKTASKATPKAKTSPPSQDTSTTADSGNIFDDPLNALGRN